MHATQTVSIAWLCETCGTQFEPTVSPPAHCPICEDERQYVGWSGQRWTTPAALARDHTIHLQDEDGIATLRLQPAFGIGQRAFLIPQGSRFLMWECLSLVTPEAIADIRRRGEVSAIAISHPHFYTSMVQWSEALGGIPIYVHAADREWVQRASAHLRFWQGDRLALTDDLVLIHLPGHFPGSAGLWWRTGPRGGVLLPGDALQVVMDRRHVTFMYSYPNLMPLGPTTVRRLQQIVEPLEFEDVYGYSVGRQIIGGGKAAVLGSFNRYLSAIESGH